MREVVRTVRQGDSVNPVCAEDESLPTMERLRKRAQEEKIPLFGTIDITHRCNLRCVHCYLGSHENEQYKAVSELRTGALIELLHDCARAGCLRLLISGGEPLLRDDFCDIYTAACKLGMYVTLFTNGTLISDKHIELFQEYTPYLVEITLYGSTEKTYESVTGVKGSYNRCINALHKLVKKGVRTGLKTMILKTNAHEVGMMNEMAKTTGLKFRADPLVIPGLAGDDKPCEERLSPLEAVAVETAIPEKLVKFTEIFSHSSLRELYPGHYQCAAGRSAFYVGPSGMMKACLMSNDISCNLLKTGFINAWKSITSEISGLRHSEMENCLSCEIRPLCVYCPGLIDLEMKRDKDIRYLCGIGETRYNHILNLLNNGGIKTNGKVIRQFNATYGR